MPKINKEERTREWAIANKMFSLKTCQGKIYTPEGEELEVPNGITRYLRDPSEERAGWDIYYFGHDNNYHHTRTQDQMFNGDFRKSLEAAIQKYLKESKYPLMRGKTSHHPKEHSHKKTKLDHPGIRFGKAYLTRRKMNTYFFAVTVGDKRNTVYIGVDSTWEQNYDEKFAIASAMHEQMKREFMNEREFVTN